MIPNPGRRGVAFSGMPGLHHAMQVYVINLNRSTDRMSRMSARLRHLGIPYDRVEAIDARDPVPRAQGFEQGSDLSPAEIACAESHARAWASFLSSKASCCLVLEDDVVLSATLKSFVGSLRALPPGIDVLKLETWGTPVWLDRSAAAILLPSQQAFRLRSTHLGAAGYVLTRAAAERLVSDAARPTEPVDILLFGRPGRRARPGSEALAPLRAYQLVPALVIQESRLPDHAGGADLASTIEPSRRAAWRQASARRTVFQKVLRELGRPFRRLVALPPSLWTARRIVVRFGQP